MTTAERPFKKPLILRAPGGPEDNIVPNGRMTRDAESGGAWGILKPASPVFLFSFLLLHMRIAYGVQF